MGKNTNPNFPSALDLMRHGLPSRLDLPGSHFPPTHRLETVRPKGEPCSSLGLPSARAAEAVLLPAMDLLRLKHGRGERMSADDECF